MRYRTATTKNKVITISTYAGKIVKGVAKCSPEDEYSLETGKTLSKARCDAKIADKRVANATRKFEAAVEAFEAAQRHLNKMKEYLESSHQERTEAYSNLENIENSLK